MVQANVP